MHSGAFASDADRDFAIGFDNSRTHAEALCPELRIAHTVTIARDVVETFAGFLVGFGVKSKGCQNVIDFAVVQLITPLLGPLLGQITTGAVDGLGHFRKVLLAW